MVSCCAWLREGENAGDVRLLMHQKKIDAASSSVGCHAGNAKARDSIP